jgi:ubiquinone biosynthesis protein Coq4
MKILGYSDSQKEIIVRGMVTIASLNRTKSLSQLDAGLINGIQHHILHADINIEGLDSITPADFASAFEDEKHAEQAMQMLIITPYSETEANKQKVALVDNFADALGVHPETQTLLHEARDRHVLAMEFCIYRKLAPGMLKGDKVIDKFKFLKNALVAPKYDYDLAMKHERLGLLPEGTLGRSIFEFYRTRGFTFPGEGHHGINEDFILIHDISHIIGGFNTTPEGEIRTSAFQGGYKMDGHGWLFAVIGVLDFQLGLDAYTGPATVKTGQLDAEGFAEALEMGMNCNLDLFDWDPWAHMGRQLNDLRKEYNIVGAKDIHRTPPEGAWAEPPETWWEDAVTYDKSNKSFNITGAE